MTLVSNEEKEEIGKNLGDILRALALFEEPSEELFDQIRDVIYKELNADVRVMTYELKVHQGETVKHAIVDGKIRFRGDEHDSNIRAVLGPA